MPDHPRPLVDFETCVRDVDRICRPYRLASPRWREFRGSIRNFTAAALNLTELHLGRCRMSRVAAPGSDGRPPYYSLILQLCGSARVSRRRDEVILQPGDLVLLYSDDGIAVDASDGTRQVALNFIQPRDIDRLDVVRRIAPGRLAVAPGPAALLRDAVLSVVRNAGHLDTIDVRDHVIDLLLASFGQVGRPGGARTLDVESLTRGIDAALGDVALCPQRLAESFDVSLRTLHRIAAAADTTPAALIWQRRLHRARELLSRDAEATVTGIAHRCGFKDSAHFSRAYARAFGEPPSATRPARR